jgi:hypothetical protein
LAKGYPVLICGTTDKHKQFHPFSLNICSHETEDDYAFMFAAIRKAAKKFYDYEYRANTLIADAAPAIHNGFMKAFNYSSLHDFKRVMCWSHVYRNCEGKLKSIQADIRDSILEDIKAIQAMPSTKAFNVAVEKFFEKWEDEPKVKDFFSTCSCTWYLKHYSCYHLIAVATHEKLVQIPNEFKDLPLEAKPKRGRRAIAKLALEKHSI